MKIYNSGIFLPQYAFFVLFTFFCFSTPEIRWKIYIHVNKTLHRKRRPNKNHSLSLVFTSVPELSHFPFFVLFIWISTQKNIIPRVFVWRVWQALPIFLYRPPWISLYTSCIQFFVTNELVFAY